MPMSDYWPIAGAVIAPNVGGLINSYIAHKNIESWYKNLNKPSWTPPNWVFGPVWTSIYCSIGYSSWMVIRDSPSTQELILPMSVYGTNLALNWAWSPIFFSLRKIKWAFYELITLWGCTAALGVVFYRVNKTAGFIIAPYLAWSTYALALNYSIMKLNPSEGETPGPSPKEKVTEKPPVASDDKRKRR